MHASKIPWLFYAICTVLFLSTACMPKGSGGLPYHATEGPIVHHDLEIVWKARPDPHLIITDQLFLNKATPEGEEISFILSPHATEVVLKSDESVLTYRITSQGGFNRYVFSRPKRAKRVDVHYELQMPGALHDPGEIGEDGIYLPAFLNWHPTRPGEPTTLRWQMVMPRTWLVAAPGQQSSRSQEGTWQQVKWQADGLIEGLDLISGPFEFRQVPGEGGAPNVQGFFRSNHPALAHAWTFAANRQLEFLRGRVGNFPTHTFRIIELPERMQWAGQWEMPAASIVSSQILQNASPDNLVASAILETYWGRFPSPEDAGDWRPAAQAYLTATAPSSGNKPPTDYEERDAWLRHWGADEGAENSHPLSEKAPMTPARLGRGAMVLHQLHEWVGPETFHRALKDLVASGSPNMAAWQTLQLAFEKELARPMDWFFDPWLNRMGAPTLKLASASLDTLQNEDGERLEVVKVVIQRDGLRVPLRVPVVVDLDMGQITRPITVDEFEVEAYIALTPLSDGQREKFPQLGNDPPGTHKRFAQGSANYDLGGSLPGKREASAEAVRLDPNFDVLRELWPEEWQPRVAEIIEDKSTPILFEKGSSDEKLQKALMKRLDRNPVSPSEMRFGRHSTIAVARWSAVEESTLYLGALELSIPSSLFHRAGTVWHRDAQGGDDDETTADRFKNYPADKVTAALSIPHPKRAGYGILVFLTHDEQRLMESIPALSGAGQADYLLMGGAQILARGRHQNKRHAMYKSLQEDESDGF